MADDSNGVSEIDQLLLENAQIKNELGIPVSSAATVRSVDWVEKENEVLAVQLNLLKRNRALLDKNDTSNEALYLLQYLSSIPLPTWSATSEGKIAHWAGAAEKVYKHKAERAIGRNFVDLFVIEPEKKQAILDLHQIINGQEGLEHFNLCRDSDKDGRRVYLITCCFPVFDPRRNEIVQAEISFDLSQLDALKEELDDLHKRHSAEKDEERSKRIERERALMAESIHGAFAMLKQHYEKRHDDVEKRITINREKIASAQSKPAERELHRNQLKQNEQILADLNKWEADTKDLIASANTLEQLRSVEATIKQRIRSDV